MLPPFRAIILDLDGLVLDTETTYRLAWQRAAADLGFPLSDEFCRSLTGRHYDDVERALCAAWGERFSLSAFRDLASRHWRGQVSKSGIAVKPGFAELMQVLSDCRIGYCLATNSRRENTLQCLELAGIGDAFPHIVARDEVAAGKPAPDLFLAAAKRLQVSPAACLAAEDSDIGIEAAWRAGATALMIPCGRPPSEKSRRRAFRILDSLSQLAALIGEKVKQSPCG